MNTDNKKHVASIINEVGVSFNPLLSSRSFWREHTLIAIDRCRMMLSNRPTLTIGKEYKPILKYLNEKEFMIIDDEGRNGGYHSFDWTDLQTYFKVVQVAKKNGR